jgi:hypothetical protein
MGADDREQRESIQCFQAFAQLKQPKNLDVNCFDPDVRRKFADIDADLTEDQCSRYVTDWIAEGSGMTRAKIAPFIS